ncbi:MAG: hypothetical protein O7H41_14735 [Planctomycetota bacterium]|nr:hypothetical protein [Planctomycetota bacterium]
MSPTLERLAAGETEVLRRTAATEGAAPEKFRLLHERGVFTEYGSIYEQYVGMIADGDPGTEALKRALFLQWYAQLEPATSTGLWDLDDEGQDEIIRELDRRAIARKFDEELRMMLSHYYSVAPHYFDSQEEGHSLKLSLRDDEESAERPGVASMERRGQMGDYWRGVLESGVGDTFEGEMA